jgi:hypothetical protein
MKSNRKRRLIALLGAGGYFAWRKLGGDNLPPGFASGNGRIVSGLDSRSLVARDRYRLSPHDANLRYFLRSSA